MLNEQQKKIFLFLSAFHSQLPARLPPLFISRIRSAHIAQPKNGWRGVGPKGEQKRPLLTPPIPNPHLLLVYRGGITQQSCSPKSNKSLFLFVFLGKGLNKRILSKVDILGTAKSKNGHLLCGCKKYLYLLHQVP